MKLNRLVAAAAIALGLLPVSAAQAEDATPLVLQLRVTASSTKVETTESKSFNLLGGNPRWNTGSAVEYRVVGAPSAGAVAAVEASAATIDAYVTTRTFVHNDATTQGNPCRPGEPNIVRWAPLDGQSNLLAQTELCISKKEIVGFRTTIDSDDGWSVANDGNPLTFDVQAVVTHEFGHVAGLDHITKPGDACLTMYPNTEPEDTQQRTLGLGDKLGLDRLYGSGDVSPGPGCGA